MAVRIRLSRTGRRHIPTYRIAVYDSRTRRDGPCIELLGQYDPRQEKPEKKITMKVDRYKHWISVGALPTESLDRIVKHTGVLKG